LFLLTFIQWFIFCNKLFHALLKIQYFSHLSLTLTSILSFMANNITYTQFFLHHILKCDFLSRIPLLCHCWQHSKEYICPGTAYPKSHQQICLVWLSTGLCRSISCDIWDS
jgi:hypothetical protein